KAIELIGKRQTKISFPTQPVSVHKSNDWDTTTRKHPALVWFEKYTRSYDTNGPSFDGWLTEDFIYQNSDGTEHHGREGFEEVKRNYGVFTKYNLVPYSFYCIETDYGYEFVTQALMYINLLGNTTSEEKNVTNPREGTQWEGKLPGAYRFEIRKIGEDFRIRRCDVHIDTAPAIA
ncbi:hypothetical protein LTR93_012354, partial [Exophiala xenobiotica]